MPCHAAGAGARAFHPVPESDCTAIQDNIANNVAVNIEVNIEVNIGTKPAKRTLGLVQT